MFNPFMVFDDYFELQVAILTDWVHINDKFDYDRLCFMRSCVHHHHLGRAISTADTTDGHLSDAGETWPGRDQSVPCECDVLAQRS